MGITYKLGNPSSVACTYMYVSSVGASVSCLGGGGGLGAELVQSELIKVKIRKQVTLYDIVFPYFLL